MISRMPAFSRTRAKTFMLTKLCMFSAWARVAMPCGRDESMMQRSTSEVGLSIPKSVLRRQSAFQRVRAHDPKG